MNYKEIWNLFYIKKDYSEVKRQLETFNDSRSFNMLGKYYLWNGDIEKAHFYFNKGQHILGCAYCHLIKEDIEGARILVSTVFNSSPVINWLMVVINLINNTNGEYPTYFQIRNFYEQDFELFFKYKKNNFIKTILDKQEYFEFFNREIYKYTGRVLLNNDRNTLAEEYLKKSLDIFYNDPETHFLLGELYLKRNEIEQAKKSFETSNKVNEIYNPALNKLKDLLN